MTMGEAAIQRTTVHFSGHVQGVGFRYTVMQVARGFEATGFVQNLADGRVLLVAEGEPREVDGMIAGVCDRMVGYIRSMDRHNETGLRRHSGFMIR